MVSAALIQSKVYYGYGKAGAVLGFPFDIYRPPEGPVAPIIPANKVTTLPAQFTNAKASGFNFDKGQTYDDVLFNVLVDAAQLQIGDYLVGASATYFVAAMPPMQPVACVQCNRIVTVTRPGGELVSQAGSALPSQTGGTGKYFGTSRQAVASGAGEVVLGASVPVCILGTTGRATGTGELPADTPGPSRWRIHLPPSVFPEGGILNRDLVTDQDGQRYQVSSNSWSVIGYRAEAIRLEL